MCESDRNESAKILGLLGLCARAGRLVLGTPMICESLKAKKEILMVLMAEGVSENTRKRLSDRCGFYGVRLESVKVTTAELAHALGKSGELAAVGVTDPNFASGLEKLLM